MGLTVCLIIYVAYLWSHQRLLVSRSQPARNLGHQGGARYLGGHLGRARYL